MLHATGSIDPLRRSLPGKRLGSPFHALLIALLFGASTAAAAAPGVPELLIIARETKFYVPNQTEMTVAATLPPGSLLKTSLDRANPGIPVPRNFCAVYRMEPCLLPAGWIDCRDAFNLYPGPQKRFPFTYSEVRPRQWDVEALPTLIKRQPEHIQRAWRDVEMAFQQMKKLRQQKELKQELPEPYFARALLWGQAGNHEDALRDYHRAGSLVKASGGDLVAYSKYFVLLVDALKNRVDVPRPPVPGEGETHFLRGKQAYFSGQLDDALIYLDNAVQVEPANPLYWYYRSLANKRLGQNELALHDAILGADLERVERKQRYYSPYHPDYIDTGLERIQDPSLRLWLTRVRKGDPVLRRSILKQREPERSLP